MKHVVTATAVLVMIAALWAIFWPQEGMRENDHGRQVSSVEHPRAPLLEGRPSSHPHILEVDVASLGASADADARKGAVKGVVVERANGAPVPMAHLAVLEAGQEYVELDAAQRANAAGQFEIEAVPNQSLLFAWADGFEPSVTNLSVRTPAPLRLELGRGATISGAVIGEGMPLGGARVWCYLPGDRLGWPHTHARLRVGAEPAGAQVLTDERGRFTLTGLRPDQTYILRAAKAGWSLRRDFVAAPRRVRAGTQNVELQMTAFCDITVEVLDAETDRKIRGHGSLGGIVRAGFQQLMYDFSDDLVDLNGLAVPVSNRYRLVRHPSLRPRSSTIRVGASALGYEAKEQQVVPTPGTPQIVQVRLVPIKDLEWGDVRFAASHAAGEAFSGELWLNLSGSAGQVSRLVTFKSGRSAPLHLPVGSYRVIVSGGGHQGQWRGSIGSPTTVQIERGTGGDRVVQIEVTGRRVYLDVRDSSQRAVRGYSLSVANAAGGPEWPVRDWDAIGVLSGAVKLDSRPYVFLAPGVLNVAISHPAYETLTQTIDVPPGHGDLTVQYILRPGR